MAAEWIYNAIGLIGVALFLWAYAMINLGYWTERQARFHVPNLVGAGCMIISLSHNWNLPTFVLEICWGTMAIIGIWRSQKR
jgi:peptidoglycan/LPS O-acetylase OafA/YrhL